MKFRYEIIAPRGANIPKTAPSGEALDRILLGYRALGGNVGALRIRPVVVVEQNPTIEERLINGIR